MTAALVAAVPWWVWAILATITGCSGTFCALCVRAPMDTDIWPGGEPRPGGTRRPR